MLTPLQHFSAAACSHVQTLVLAAPFPSDSEPAPSAASADMPAGGGAREARRASRLWPQPMLRFAFLGGKQRSNFPCVRKREMQAASSRMSKTAVQTAVGAGSSLDSSPPIQLGQVVSTVLRPQGPHSSLNSS